MKVYLGIDVSKGYSDFCLLKENGKLAIKPFQLDDTAKGYELLFNLFKEISSTEDVEIFSAVESTGGYENNWYNFLLSLTNLLPLQVTRLNPIGVKNHADASMERNKTDKTSSYHIADYLRKYPENIRYNEENPHQTMRKFWNYIVLQSKMIRQLSNNLLNTIYSANPELLSHCKHGLTDKVLEILKAYPTAKRLAKAKMKRLSKINGVSEQEAKKMITAAKISVASLSDVITEDIIKNSATQIQQITMQTNKSVKSILKEHRPKEIDLLMTIPGIGEKTALGLYLEIGSVFRFQNSKELSSYAGIHPMVRESGDGSKRPKMSKRGRKNLRTVLFMPAMCAANCDPYLKAIYDKHIKKGKSKMCALGIIMHKLLRIAYGVLKSGKPYNAEIDKKNSSTKKRVIKNEVQEINSLRRFQDYESTAPISKHAAKKRKQSTSHSCEAKNSAGSKTAENDNMQKLQPVNNKEKNDTIIT